MDLNEERNKGSLTIIRKSEVANSFKQYNIYVDGRRSAYIYNDGVVSLKLNEGNYEVYISVDFYKTEKLIVDIKNRERTFLSVGKNNRKILIGIGLKVIDIEGLTSGDKVYSDNELYSIVVDTILSQHVSENKEQALNRLKKKSVFYGLVFGIGTAVPFGNFNLRSLESNLLGGIIGGLIFGYLTYRIGKRVYMNWAKSEK